MDYRADLVRLITEGTQLGDIIDYLTTQDFSYSEAHGFIRWCGVEFLIPKQDVRQDISPERKRELDLSFT